MTQIVPTNEYLNRYLVTDTSDCSLCLERDTTLHQIYDCEKISNFISFIFEDLNTNCNTDLQIQESRDQYLFGIQGKKHVALNQILLELKIFNFYYVRENPRIRNDILKNIFFARIEKIILKEKFIAVTNKKYDDFDEKWKMFTPIYDYRGPDPDHVS